MMVSTTYTSVFSTSVLRRERQTGRPSGLVDQSNLRMSAASSLWNILFARLRAARHEIAIGNAIGEGSAGLSILAASRARVAGRPFTLEQWIEWNG